MKQVMHKNIDEDQAGNETNHVGNTNQNAGNQENDINGQADVTSQVDAQAVELLEGGKQHY